MLTSDIAYCREFCSAVPTYYFNLLLPLLRLSSPPLRPSNGPSQSQENLLQCVFRPGSPSISLNTDAYTIR